MQAGKSRRRLAMKSIGWIFMAMGAVFALATITSATTIHVPGDSATIQAGINGAVEGDTVLVADGTYTGDGNRDIDFGGKSIVVMSENGPEVTIIDAAGELSEPHRGFIFRNGESQDATLQGFTITGGVADDGGAIYCTDASPTIRSNILASNRSSIFPGQGGGIFCSGGAPIIENNIFNSNFSRRGGAVFCRNSSLQIIGNIIEYNRAVCDPRIWYGGFGGGIYCEGGSPVIAYNSISDNEGYSFSQDAYSRSGGVFCDSVSNGLILFNVISFNDGSALWFSNNSSVTATNNTLSHNYSCAINVSNSIITLDNNTISFNLKSFEYWRSSIFMSNNNFFENPWDSEYIEIDTAYAELMSQIGINGNCSVNPLFCDTANGDFHLSSASYCAPEYNNGEIIGALGIGCDGGYICGDATGDYTINVGDPVYLICHIFKGGPPPFAVGAGDANCDGVIDVGDAIYLINNIFKNGPEPCCP